MVKIDEFNQNPAIFCFLLTTKVKDLHDLFSLGEDTENGTETGDLFADVADEMVAVSSTREKGDMKMMIEKLMMMKWMMMVLKAEHDEVGDGDD
eukprot:746062-Hanusia_phi.AAC.1